MKADSYIVTYARTLLEVAEERGKLGDVREEVEFFIQMSKDEQQTRFRMFLESPRIERSEKEALLEKVFKGKTTDILYRFYLLVVRNGRESGITDMFELFCELHDEKIGLVHVDVTTAVEMSEEVEGHLREALEKKLGKKVRLESRVDESILGGMVARFSGMVADSSLKTALNRIGGSMTSIKLGSELVHEN